VTKRSTIYCTRSATNQPFNAAPFNPSLTRNPLTVVFEAINSTTRQADVAVKPRFNPILTPF